MWKKLQGWKEKLLSRAGKEVLLKVVIQSIPTYMMTLFFNPDGILDEINSLCARFWLGGGECIELVGKSGVCRSLVVGWVFEI